MTVRLSKGIGEIQQEELRFIWQPPDIYADVHDNNIWLIYGRKGSGKSTLVDYLGVNDKAATVLVVRPRDNDLFNKVLVPMAGSKGTEDRIIEEGIACAVEFALCTSVIRKIIQPYIEQQSFIPRKSPVETMYNFMTSNKLHEGSVLRKAIAIFTQASGSLKVVPSADALLDKLVGPITFEDARDALLEHCKTLEKGVLICIDDIDEIGFSFSHADRLFINGLLIYMVRNNVRFLEHGSKIRILLTTPSELYFHSSMWGADWISGKSACLTWNNTNYLQELVNKRIAKELGVKKHKPRFEGDKFSIDPSQTWDKLFPSSITNKMGKQESAFDYIVRHTFYTPRHVLAVCDPVIASANEIGVEATNRLSSAEASEYFQKGVEEFSLEAARDFRDLFAKIYHGLEEILEHFRSRPYIWNYHQLHTFIRDRNMVLRRIDSGEEITAGRIAVALQRIGFLGLGVRLLSGAPPGTEGYEVKFSFLEKLPYRGGWEIAVVSPLFFDSYNMHRPEGIIVRPHARLYLPLKACHLITNYDPNINL